MGVNDYTMLPTARTPWKFERSRIQNNAVVIAPVFSVNAAAAKFNMTAFAFTLNGELLYFAAKVAQVFSAVHATGIGNWLGIGIYCDRDGNILTVGNPNTGDQDYATEDLALASIPSAPAGFTLVGQFTLKTTAADWDANTDALDDADLASSNLLGVQSDRRVFVGNLGYNYQLEGFKTWCRVASGVANLNLFAAKQTTTGCVTNPHIQVDRRTVANPTVTKLRFGAFDAVLGGVLYHIAAQKQLAFTAAHKVTADKWGAILLLVDPTTGTYSTLVGAATQTTALASANSAAARAALPAVPAGKVAIGVLVVEAGGADWTANTDDIVAGSDLENFDLIPYLMDRSLSGVTLAIDATPERFKSSVAFTFSLEGVRYSKAIATGIQFSAAHQCTASKYLAILIEINAAGTVSTRVPLVSGRSQTTAQGYDSYDLALAALPNTEADKLAIGVIVVLADGTGWLANTDDLTPGSDLTNSWFIGFNTGQKNGVAGIIPTAQNDLWPVSGAQFNSSRPVNAPLPNPTAPNRGWSTADTAVYVASSTGLVSDVRADWVHRPFPLNGEVG